MVTRTEARNRLTLHFLDREVEQDYRQKLRPRARRQFRASTISSIALWPIAAGVAYPQFESGPTVIYLTSAMCLILLLLLAIERWTRSLGGLHLLGAISNTSAGFAALAVLWSGGAFPTLGPFSVLLISVFSFTLLGLPFAVSLAAIVPYVVVCVVLMVLNPDMAFVPFQILMLAIGTGILTIATYMRETAARRDFYLTRIIADQERELEEEMAKQLGQYTLESKLGQGGMGVVYRAKHSLLRRPTAVKLLSTDDAKPEDLARFEREVQLTSELSHPNIVAVYDYGHSPQGEFYYAMEYLSGVDLESLVDEWGPMPPERAVPILVQVCDALDEAHYRGLVHRDIKPGNIVLSRVGKRTDVVKVVDFGLVKDIDAPSELTADNHIAGTPAYLAPEALTDPDAIGPSSDLYAVGAVGFYLLTGERVFTGRTVAEVFGHHLHTEPRPPSLVAEDDVPAALDALILRCLAKRPSERHRDAGALRDALSEIELPDYRDGADWWDAFDASREKERSADDERGEIKRSATEPHALTVDLRRR